MKAWVLSDLHYDFGGIRLYPPDEADIAIVAGDAQGDQWLTDLATMLPTVFVAGNHEFYGWDYRERVASLSAIPNLHFLNDNAVTLGGVRIAGATLWTDYGYSPIAAEIARRSMSDHRRIKWRKKPYERFLPSHAAKMHETSRAFLSGSGADVIVTHHAPSERSIHPKYAGQVLNRAYYSDVPLHGSVWIHGHVHSSWDYVQDGTRVLCNPKGYPGENMEFKPNLTVKL